MEQAVLTGTITSRCTVAATALYLYDMALNSSDSIELIWCHKISPASVLYFLNRYLILLWLVLQLVLMPEKDCSRAYVLHLVSDGIMCSLIFVFAALSAIRVLSLNFYGFDWKLPALVSSVVLFQFGTDIYTYSRSRSVVLLAPPYCTMQYTVPVDLDYRLKVAVRVLNCIHDALILLFTWYKTRGQIREYGSALYMRNTLMTRLLLNGVIYFIVHLVLNILDAVLTVTGTFDDITVFNAVFTPLILSHFFLSIRKAHYAKEQLVSTPSQMSDLNFRHTQPPEDGEGVTEGVGPHAGTTLTEGHEDNEDWAIDELELA